MFMLESILDGRVYHQRFVAFIVNYSKQKVGILEAKPLNIRRQYV